MDHLDRVKKLEAELSVANEVATRLTKELEEVNAKLKTKEESSKKKPPLLGTLPKIASGEVTMRDSSQNEKLAFLLILAKDSMVVVLDILIYYYII